MSENPILRVNNLSVAFRTDRGPLLALRNSNFKIKKGEVFGLAGESGSGKSTMALAIVNYLPSNGYIREGKIMFKGDDILKKSQEELRKIRGNEITMVYQNPGSSLNPSMKVGKQISEVIELHQNLSKDKSQKHALEYLELVDIPDPEYNAQRYPHQLSGGMQQRVILAMALSCNPSLLLMDEPTTGLDVTVQAKILDLVSNLKDELSAAILFITHDLSVISRICDKVGIIYAGEIIETGSIKEVFGNSAHPYTIGLLDAIPKLDVEKKFRPIGGKLPDLTKPSSGCIFAPRCNFQDKHCNEKKPTLRPFKEEHHSKCFKSSEVNERISDQFYEDEPLKQSSSYSEKEVIKIKDLKKHFGHDSRIKNLIGIGEESVKAVDGVSFQLHKNETFALIGESGCGKSTLGLSLLALHDTDAGQIEFDGQEVGKMKSEELSNFRRNAQIVFQHPDSSLNPRKTVKKILARYFKLAGGKVDNLEKKIGNLLQTVELDKDMMERYPSELSGGQKQRVAIARAFACNPKLVILDEPASALDVSIQASILELLIRLQRKLKSAYLYISHDLSVVRHIADRVGVMYLGKLCEIGEVNDVFNPPHHPYTEALLSSIPEIEPSKTKEQIQLEGSVPSARNLPSGCRFSTRCPNKSPSECTETEPRLTHLGNDHYIACHLYEE